MPNPYSIPAPYSSPYGESIADLMVRQGDIAAQRAGAGGAIWGQALANLGQIVGGAIERRQEQKQQSKRDEALSALINSDVWATDPQAAYGASVKILGHREGPKFADGMFGAMKLREGTQNPEEARQSLRMMAGALAAAPDSMRPQLYGAARGIAVNARIGKAADWPEQWSDEMLPMAKALAGEKQGQTSAEIEAEAAARARGAASVKPPEPTLAQIEAEAAARARGTASVKPPAAPKEAKLYEVEVPGPNGTIVKKLVSEAELRAGVTTAPKSVGNKPVTGAERQALAFFNRAKQASEDVANIEDEMATAGLGSQVQLEKAPAWLQTEKQKAYRQAQRAFTEARLRKESGAAIPESEFENDRKTYWAQPGESAESIAQKRRAREVVLQGLAYGSGRAYEEFYGEPLQTPASTKKAETTPGAAAGGGAAPARPKHVPAGYHWDASLKLWVP